MNQTAHIIGNGISNSVVDIPVHFTVSCNIPTHNVPFDVTTIIDVRVLEAMQEQSVTFTQPVWCTQVVADSAVKKKVSGTFLPILESQHRKNSGHHAAEQCARMGYTHIHLWGMDSIFREDLSSQMDNLIPRPHRANMTVEWRGHWSKIGKQYATTRFYVHTINVNTLHKDYGENFWIISHEK